MAGNLDFSGLDKYTERMYQRVVHEYPQIATNFLENQINSCKNEVTSLTPRSSGKKKGKHLQDNWKTQIRVKKGHQFAVLKNSSPHAHLIENGHLTKNGGFVEGTHMLEKTMTRQQPKIDRAIESLVDEIFDV